MVLDYADECFVYLNEAQSYINKFEEIDMYSAIFEAKSADVEAKIINNSKSNQGAFGALKKAAQSVVNLIAGALKTIIGGIESLFSSKSTKNSFAAMKAMMKQNPELANKPIRFFDFKHNTKEWQRLEAAAAEADQRLSAGEDVNINDLLSDITRYTKGIGKGAVSTVSAQAAINACYGSKSFARTLSGAMARDGKIMAEITDALGEKEAKRFKKEVNSLAKDNKIAKLFGKRVNLKRAMNKSRVMQCQTLEDSIKYTMKQIEHDVTSARTALTNTKNNNDLYASGGVKNFFRRQGNKVKSAGNLGKLYTDDGVRRGIRIIQDNPDANEAITKGMNIVNKHSADVRSRGRETMINRREGDYDIADYNRRVSKGDYSAQSLPSFMAGRNTPFLNRFNDQGKMDREREARRRATLDDR